MEIGTKGKCSLEYLYPLPDEREPQTSSDNFIYLDIEWKFCFHATFFSSYINSKLQMH